MRSQSLFNFFTKVADVQTTPGGPRVITGADSPARVLAHRAQEAKAKAKGQVVPPMSGPKPTAAAVAAADNLTRSADAAYNAEQKRRAGMTQEQRWDEDFNNHLSDQAGAGKDQYNFAYDNYSKDLEDAVARGSMSKQDAAAARQHIINGVRAKQRQFHSDYLKSYDNGDHTASDRQGMRGTKIWTTHSDNGLVHFRHGDFGENTTFGGAERGYAQRDARTAAGGGRGGAGANAGQVAGVRGGSTGTNAPARGAAPQMPNNRAQAARPNDASRAFDMHYGPKQQPTQAKQAPAAPVATDPASTTARQGNAMMRGGAQANASKVTPTAPPSPINFKGGYTVGGVSGDIDWAAKGDGSIHVSGANLTADQYNAFNNVRSSLTTQLRQQEGLGAYEAKARANQLANQWMADQVAVANGGKAQNRWQHVDNPQPAAQPAAPATPAQPATQPAAQPAAPATPPQAPDGEINSMVSFAEPTAGQNAGAQPGAQDQAQNTAQQAAGQPVTWDLEAGKKDPMGYIKHHTQALDADTIRGWNIKEREGWTTQDGKLNQKGYYEGMAGRHYNNMQNLYRLAYKANLSDNDRDEVMKALNQEARLYSQYKYTGDRYASSTAEYKPGEGGVDPLLGNIDLIRNQAPAAFGWNDYQARATLPVEIKDYINKHYD